MQVDYIVVGQGVSGSFLSWYLWKAGKKVLVIDQSQAFTASKVASGVINPVTGRRIVSTWMIDELMPFALDAYTTLGAQLGVPLIEQKNILDFHATPQMMLAFNEKFATDKQYLNRIDDLAYYEQYFNFFFGIGEINPCYLVDLSSLIEHWRKALLANNSLLEAKLVFADAAQDLQHDASQPAAATFTLQDEQPFVTYKAQTYTASAIFFCDGTSGFDSPYFKMLPYARNKGEAIIAEIPDLPRNNIYKQGITLVPWKNNQWWIGSTYDWQFPDLLPTQAFRNKVELHLQQWLKLPYSIVDHIATDRPANLERRPFAGYHPLHPNVGILNGMGTKGCSLAPYFAHQIVQEIIDGTPILPAADVQRFRKVLSR